MILPYVYKLTHRETGEFYIGFRKSNKVKSEFDLGFKYFSSSKKVKQLGFENFNIEIIAEFFDEDEAFKYEQLLIKENFNDPLILNKNFYSNKLHHNYGIANIGRKLTLEHKNKISQSSMGKNIGKKYFGKDNSFYNKKHTNISKEKISIANKISLNKIETKNKMRNAKLGKPSLKRTFSFHESIMLFSMYKAGTKLSDLYKIYENRCTKKTIRETIKRFYFKLNINNINIKGKNLNE